MKLPASPLLTAAGGVNVSYQAYDAGFSASNPALFEPSQHYQLQLSFNGFPSGIRNYALSGAVYNPKNETVFGGQVFFVDYGNIPQADASGMRNGDFRPIDFFIQASASKKYLERWRYGANLKFIQSSYGQYSSTAMALDFGMHYNDSAIGFSAGLVAKNMGFQLKTYAGEADDMPFDLQVGITKRLLGSPFGFSFTAYQLHRFDLVYNDADFNEENDLRDNDRFANQLLNHFVFAGHIYIGKNLEAALGFNHLRRNELNAGAAGNGLTGFSMGLKLKLQKLQVQYARSNYQKNIAFNQLGLTLHADRLFGWGKL